MPEVVEVTGMKELISRMQQFPQKLNVAMKAGMDASLSVLWENVPPYPPPPETSTYRRTGTLGRTLGSNFSGGKSGKPEIYQTKKLGDGYQGRFGTNLNYAPHVIGEGTQSRVHRGRWWTLKTVAEKAQSKILQVWQGVVDKLARFLDGKGLL